MASTIEVDKIKHSSGVAFTLPTADGSAGHLLKTNGSAVLSFTADTDTGILNVVEDTTPQLGGDLDCNGSQIQWSKGADVASATALALLTDGNFFDVTGTVTVTSFNTTGGPGTQIKLQFDAACLLTHHATDLKLPGGANITTAAGDVAEFIEYATGDYICTSYTKADGKAVVETAPTVTLSNSVTLTNKTLTAPAVTNLTGTFNSPTGTIGTMTLGGAVTGGDQTVSAINLKDYGEITSALGSAGGSRTIDLNDGNSFTATVSASTVTWTFSNPTASDEGCGFTLVLTNGGSQTVNWPASVDWPAGTAPTLTTSGVDILTFWTVDGGTIWHGMAASTDSKTPS